MAPNVSEVNLYTSGVLFETEPPPDYEEVILNEKEAQKAKKSYRELQPIHWSNLIKFSIIHLLALYGLKLFFTDAMFLTNVWALFIFIISTLGVSAGAHRLWSHKSYKARLPLRVLLTIFNSMSFQGPIIEWARDHRTHHKFTETDADPVNVERGLFFAHIGWLLCRKHPDVIRLGKHIDLSDLQADACVDFQIRHYHKLVLALCFVFPTLVPVYVWGESVRNAFFVAGMLRYCICLHGIFTVNSLAHHHGPRPYDKSIAARDNLVANILVLGEGFHNYHHVFPWDYKGTEFGKLSNLTTLFINLMARIGWAYDLKSVKQDMVKARTMRSGDGSHPLWGWGDKDIGQVERDLTNTQKNI